jgi:PPOX class probable F420-dependent enzyme
LAGARSGHLATVRPDGSPHVVVITFAIVGDDVVTAVDEKPKTTRHLQRLVNVEANPAVSFLIDHYEENWVELWWVRVDGRATVLHHNDARDRAVEALAAKYPDYRDRPPQGPVMSVSMDRVTSWAYNG